jgi:hypothetical protein
MELYRLARSKRKTKTSNLKELTAIHLAIKHFFPKIKKFNFRSISIQNLYITMKKIWYLIDRNQIGYISGKLNTTTS